jgi:antirestriction protein ArdC
MKVEQAKQIASEAIEQLSKALERGHSEELKECLTAMARFHRYSTYNVMLILSQRQKASRVAGFHTWREFGRFVKKGAKGIMILAPVFRKKSSDAANEEDSNRLVGFRPVYVFDLADTDGEPLPTLGQTQGDPAGNTERLKEFVSSLGIQLEYSTGIYPALGLCTQGKIILLPGQSPAEEFATLAHEVGHALLHQRERRAETTKCVRETEAEAVAFVVCESIGLQAHCSADYIQLYNGSKETLAESLEHVQRASAEILAAIGPTD